MVHEFEEVYGLALLPGLIILLVVVDSCTTYQSATPKGSELQPQPPVRSTSERGLSSSPSSSVSVRLSNRRATSRVSAKWFTCTCRSSWRDRRAWALIRTGGKWETLVGGGQVTHGEASGLEALADQALELETSGSRTSEGAEIDGHICFTLHVGDATVEVVGVGLGRETASIEWRRSAGVVATLLASAVRNI